MKAIEIVTKEVNEQTNPIAIVERINGEIEVCTHNGGTQDNVEIAEAVLSKLEKAGYDFEVSWVSAIRICFAERLDIPLTIC